MSWILNFGNLPPSLRDPESSFVRIIPIPYEATTTYRKGTTHAPQSIIQASANLELWDEELSVEPCRAGICTFPPLICSSSGPEVAVREIYRYVKKIFDPSKLHIFLGGEHSITCGIVKALSEKIPSLSVLQLDAHADMRDSYMGSPYNHACVMRRVAELVSFVQLGLRSFSKEEAEFMKEKNFPFQTSNEIITEDKWKKIVEDNLSEQVYLTIDVDVLDPSIMPSVGTPEPGGIDWWKILEILKYVAGCKKIVGVDVVEFCPLPGIGAPDFLVARLIYKLIGYIIYKK